MLRVASDEVRGEDVLEAVAVDLEDVKEAGATGDAAPPYDKERLLLHLEFREEASYSTRDWSARQMTARISGSKCPVVRRLWVEY